MRVSEWMIGEREEKKHRRIFGMFCSTDRKERERNEEKEKDLPEAAVVDRFADPSLDSPLPDPFSPFPPIFFIRSTFDVRTAVCSLQSAFTRRKSIVVVLLSLSLRPLFPRHLFHSFTSASFHFLSSLLPLNACSHRHSSTRASSLSTITFTPSSLVSRVSCGNSRTPRTLDRLIRSGIR